MSPVSSQYFNNFLVKIILRKKRQVSQRIVICTLLFVSRVNHVCAFQTT